MKEQAGEAREAVAAVVTMEETVWASNPRLTSVSGGAQFPR